MRSFHILGMRVDDVTYQESLDLIDGFIRSGGSHSVVTPNPEFAMAARRDPEFLQMVNGASLAIPDGIGLMMAVRLGGRRIREHVRGTDLVHQVAELCARKGYRMFLLGAAPGVAELAAARLVYDNPGLQIAGCHSGSHLPRDDDETVARVKAAGQVDVLLVAFGAQNQEKWMARNLVALRIPVGIGVGGVFNFLSGRSRRAPAWIRGLELEWLYRLITEPWRWRRQLSLPRFAAEVFWELVVRRRGLGESESPSPPGRGSG